MKNFLLAFLMGVLILFCTCKPKKDSPPPIKALTVLYDKTDTQLTVLQADKIKDQFDIQFNHEHGAFFRSIEISDIDYTNTVQYEVKPTSLLLSNPGERNAEVAHFMQNVQNAITKLQNLPIGKPHSNIYSVVAREANTLAKRYGDRTIIIFSNLYENTDVFSSYRIADIDRLNQHPEEVEILFDKETPLSDLTGLTLHIVYQAKDYEDAKRFRLMSNLYERMFQKHGAIVIVSANL